MRVEEESQAYDKERADLSRSSVGRPAAVFGVYLFYASSFHAHPAQPHAMTTIVFISTANSNCHRIQKQIVLPHRVASRFWYWSLATDTMQERQIAVAITLFGRPASFQYAASILPVSEYS